MVSRMLRSPASSVVFIAFFFLLFTLPALACTVIVAGKDASTDGSVLNSQTADGWYDSNIRVIVGGRHPLGAMVPIYRDLLGGEGSRPVKIGEIPQAEETYKYFHTGYSCFNEHQLSIAETTIGQKDELMNFLPDARAIMTIEQLQVLALQRCINAREAVLLIGGLAEKYGFLPSCSNQGECLAIADPHEAWVFEIHSVGFGWTPDSGRPGAIWVARRVPDDGVVVIANVSRIQEIDLDDSENFMASKNYMEPAVENGWYDPSSGRPFNWQKAYSPLIGAWSLSSMWKRGRLHYIHKRLVPSVEWDPFLETRSYPFFVIPEKKISVQEIMDIFRSHMEGTPFDMEEDDTWIVRDVNGNSVKSELATPFPGRAERKLLNIAYHRPVAARTSYSFVSQSREGLPDAVGGILWFALGLPHMSCYVPIYAGTRGIPPSWRNFDSHKFNFRSARWAISLVNDMVNRRYQLAIGDLRKMRDPLEADIFSRQRKIDVQARTLIRRNPAEVGHLLTEYVAGEMERVEDAYWHLCFELIPKYTGNHYW